MALTTEELLDLMESNHERLEEIKHKANAVRLANEVTKEVEKHYD